jgi:hypothetical protein
MNNHATENWRARGLLFENCNCQLVCPGHFSFKQLCTHDPCIGHWSIHVEEGQYGATPLNGLNAVIVFRTPQLMISGGWTQVFFIDDRADDLQRAAIEKILSGRAGGAWAVLARFVSTRLETRFLPIQFEDKGRVKRMWVSGVFDTSVEALRGVDRNRDVVLENIFNQIHAPVQTVAFGSTSLRDDELAMNLEGSHALFSRFSWSQ